MGVRVRFAPSPTGHLHVGNARTALFNWLLARHEKGTFILRIEDTDVERSTEASVETIFEDLEWLGLDWDEGPGRPGAYGPYRQSERMALYAAAAERLREQGDAYPCFCPREELEAQRRAQREAGLPPRYSGRCSLIDPAAARRRAASERHILRFHVRATSVAFDDQVRGHVEFPGSQIGDPVLVRADGMPTYNFAVVVDDIAMRITHVIRGEDHLSNTPRQVLLYRAMGAPLPVFAHLSLVMGPDGAPLSKRHGDTSVADFRRRGVLPEAMANYLALLGWSHPDGEEALSLDQMVETFTLQRVGRAAAMFDARKLEWLNAQHLRARPPAGLLEACRVPLETAGFLPAGDLPPSVAEWAGRALELFAPRMDSPLDAPKAMVMVFRFDEQLGSGAGTQALAKLSAEPQARAIVARFAEEAAARPGGRLRDREAFRAAAGEAGRALGVKGRALFHPIRVAVTGSDEGPELDRIVPIIEEGSLLDLPVPVPCCADRARRVAERLP